MAESIVKLKVQSDEYDAKLKRATEGLQRYADGCRKVGGTLEFVEKDTLDFVKALGRMDTVSRTSKGSLNEMTKAFQDLSLQYRRLTDAEKQSPYGKAMAQSLDQLGARVRSMRSDMQSIDRELGGAAGKTFDFKSVIGDLGSRLGVNADMMSMVTSGTVAYTAAIGAAAAAVAYAAQQWAAYNSELNKQQQVTSVTTGLTGGDADSMTAGARSISRVYGADFREIINAANTLMTQFGVTGDEAMQLIRDGMQGMILGDGPKLLSMIQQFAPSFRDAGISASQLVAIIHNSEGGIFTDANMQAITMGIKNIRLMTKATSDALTKLGIDGQEMTRKLNEGSMTIFEALQQVSEAVNGASSGSQAAGEVMQYVFGRQGAMAGTKLGEAIMTLNTNLEDTKNQTGELGATMAKLNLVTEDFEKTLMDVFSTNGWEAMTVEIKTGLLESLNETLAALAGVRDALNGIAGIDLNVSGITKFFADTATVAYKVLNPIIGLISAIGEIKRLMGENSTAPGGDELSPEMKRVYALAAAGGNGMTIDDVTVYGHRPNGGSGGKKGGASKVEASEEQQNSAKIKKLAAEYEQASETRRAAIMREIEALKLRNAEIKMYEDIATGKRKAPGDVTSGQGVGLTGGVPDALSQPLDVSAIKTPLQSLQEELKNIIALQALAWSPEQFQSYQERIDEIREQINGFTNETKGGTASWKEAAKAVQAVGGALTQLEDPGAKIMGIIGQAIATIALSYAQASEVAARNPANAGWGWIAFAAAGLATMMSTISAIHSATGYAQGGMIKGDSYSGDNIPADTFVNAGELVLNRAQQATLAGELRGGGGAVRVTGEIQGEKIVLAANRYFRRTGQGEILTW